MRNYEVLSEAVCARPEHDPEIWFDFGRRVEAVDLCNSCPVQVECLKTNDSLRVVDGRNHGVWGGLLPGQRSVTRRRRMVAA